MGDNKVQCPHCKYVFETQPKAGARILREGVLATYRGKAPVWLNCLAGLLTAVCLCSFEAQGQSEIVSFQGNGQLTCANLPTGRTAVVDWAPSMDGPWASSWLGLQATDVDSNGVISVAVPMFYRVRLVEYLVVDLSAGPSAPNYPVDLLFSVPPGGWSDEYKTTKMVFQRIPAGTFTMGSPMGELGRSTNETQHQVTLTKDFYIGVFEVTQKQWERVMGTWPSYYSNAICRDSRPVEQVSYNDIRGASAGAGWPADNNVDADSFMGRLRARTGNAFDLPTESQWEYACRAGTGTALNSGRNLTTTTNCPNMAAVGRYLYNGGSGYTQTGDTSVATAQVGSYLPNAWGLYDMHGNVWEWCGDWYGEYSGAVTDPWGPSSGTRRSYRGGSWFRGASYGRAAFRFFSEPPTTASYGIGVRVALPLDEP
jgi:formylglycine-generating enzyme required for sulfatase activity